MEVVSLLAAAVWNQVPIAPAPAEGTDGRMWLWIALGVGILALAAALWMVPAVILVLGPRRGGTPNLPSAVI